MYETNATVVGTLITSIGRRRLPDGTPVVNFRVASNERRYDRSTDSWVDGDTLYVPVTCWRKLAENVHASFVAGDPIVVHGRLYTREFDKDGQRRIVTEMEASAVGPDLTRCTAAVTRTKRTGTGSAQSAGEDDDPLPSLGGGADARNRVAAGAAGVTGGGGGQGMGGGVIDAGRDAGVGGVLGGGGVGRVVGAGADIGAGRGEVLDAGTGSIEGRGVEGREVEGRGTGTGVAASKEDEADQREGAVEVGVGV